MEGLQAQLRYAQLRVQSLEQEMKSVKQELDQKVRSMSASIIVFLLFSLQKKENTELTNICDELLATNKR